MVPREPAEGGLPWARVTRVGQAGRLFVGRRSIPPARIPEVVRPERPASLPQFAVHPERSGPSRSGDGGNMSVAFAAPRQRGKGEITPAAIQKVKPCGVGDASPSCPWERRRGPARESAGPGAEAGLLGGGRVWEPEPRAVPEWVAEGGQPVLPRSPSCVWTLSYRHKSPSNRRGISLGMGRRSGGGARAPGGSGRAGTGCLSEPAPPAAPRVAPELLWRRPAQRAAAALRTPDLGSREAEGKSERAGRRPPLRRALRPTWGARRRTWRGDAARVRGADEGGPPGLRGDPRSVPLPLGFTPYPCTSAHTH